MILAKAPMRVSFFGGGSDIPSHYEKWGGSTLSTAIDKYVYVTVGYTPHNHIKISYAKQETVYHVDDIKNEIVKNALKYFDIDSHIEINSFADIPTIGTGLGGSSSFTCALVAALAKYKHYRYNTYDIAETACHIEINMCGWKIGKQDQYAAAFGGMNYIKYSTDRAIIQSLNPNGIDQYMVLVPTNIDRHAADIIGKIDIDEKTYVIRELSLMADLYSPYLPDYQSYSRLLNEAWNLKKSMEEGISNPAIDNLYEQCIINGAGGAKLLGAGGGGYMLALTEDKEKIKKAFSDRICLDVTVAQEGARVVYSD